MNTEASHPASRDVCVLVLCKVLVRMEEYKRWAGWDTEAQRGIHNLCSLQTLTGGD